MTPKHLCQCPARRLPILALLQVILSAAPAAAQIIDWDNIAGGDYAMAANWNPANVPNTAVETARFDVASTYNFVFVPGNTTTIDDLLVGAGDVTFGSGFFGGDATLNISDDLLINGGDLTLGQVLGALDVNLNITDNLQIQSGSTFSVLSGAAVTATELFLAIGGGDGTMIVDGVGSSVTGSATSIWGFDGDTADVAFRNGATGNLGGILLASSATVGTSGIFNIESSATVTTDGLFVASGGGATTSGMITVDGGASSLTQNGASLLIVGHATSGTGTINVQNGGTFSTGTGTTTVSATGTINVGVVGSGTFNANGNVNVDGGTLDVQSSGVFNASNTSTITVNATGLLNVDGGTFNAIGTTAATAGGTVNSSGTVNVGGSGLLNLNSITIDVGIGGVGGNFNALAGTVDLAGTGQILGNGGNSFASGSNIHGGNGGALNISGSGVTAVDSSQILFSGGNGDSGGGTNTAGRGGEGGTTTVSAGSLVLHDSTILRLDGGNAGSTHQGSNRGGHGGTLDVSGGR